MKRAFPQLTEIKGIRFSRDNCAFYGFRVMSEQKRFMNIECIFL